jgi:subtilase family serine protease
VNIKRFTLKAAGGLLAAAFVVTALAGSTKPAAADLSCPSPCSVDTRPDLVVTKFDVTVNRDGSLQLFAIVKNAGLTNAIVFSTRYYINGTYVAGSTFALAAGESKLVGPYPIYGYCPSGNPLAVKVFADATDHIDEANEGNNEVQKSVVC